MCTTHVSCTYSHRDCVLVRLVYSGRHVVRTECLDNCLLPFPLASFFFFLFFFFFFFLTVSFPPFLSNCVAVIKTILFVLLAFVLVYGLIELVRLVWHSDIWCLDEYVLSQQWKLYCVVWSWCSYWSVALIVAHTQTHTD